MNTAQPLWFCPKLLNSVTEYFKTRCLFTEFGNVTNSTGLVSPASSIGIVLIMKKKIAKSSVAYLEKDRLCKCFYLQTG